MKYKKMQLKDLKVKSFITEFDAKKADMAIGGQLITAETTPQGCSWSASPGCTGLQGCTEVTVDVGYGCTRTK